MKNKDLFLFVCLILFESIASSPFNTSNNNLYQKPLITQKGPLPERQDSSKTLKAIKSTPDSSMPLVDAFKVIQVEERPESDNKSASVQVDDKFIKQNETEFNEERILYANVTDESNIVNSDGKKKQIIFSIKDYMIGKDFKNKVSISSNKKSPIQKDTKPVTGKMPKKFKHNTTYLQDIDIPPSMIPIFKARPDIGNNHVALEQIDPNFIAIEPIIEVSNSSIENKTLPNDNTDHNTDAVKFNKPIHNLPNTPYNINEVSTNSNNQNQNSETLSGIPENLQTNKALNGISSPSSSTSKLNTPLQSNQNPQTLPINRIITKENGNSNFNIKFVPIRDLSNTGIMTNPAMNGYNVPNSNVVRSNIPAQNSVSQKDILQINENNLPKSNSIPKTAKFSIPCHKASDVLNDIPVNSVSCSTLKEANVDSVIKDLSATVQTQHLNEKVVSLNNPDDSVAILFKTKDISLLKVYGDLLKKITITVLVPYYISKLGQQT